MELVPIPAGEFTMGSPDSESGHESDEGPEHRVKITKPFYMGKYEVMQAQYERVIGTNPSSYKGPNNPVEQVSWNDATEFCRKLSQQTGKQVRLPTEAEWEYACRAGTTGSWCCGDDEKRLGDHAWYFGTSMFHTHPVGGKRPNAWGLHDMHGNVSELCADWSDDGYYGKSPTDDPTGPANARGRAVRGGGWRTRGLGCRSAYRNRIAPADRRSGIGFRVVVDAPGP